MNTVIFITTPGMQEARRIARALVKERLAACVNIVKSVESVFFWKGKIEEAKEALLIVKTRKARLPALIRRVQSLHSYQVPEIIALTITAGNKEYLKWLIDCTK